MRLDIQTDPLREVRIAKRWALAGILGSVAALLPAYAFILGLTAQEVALVIAPAVVAAVMAIELASRWEYRMRRRYAYPHRLGYELGSIHDVEKACARGAELVGQWLNADSAVVAWLTDDAQALAPLSAYGMPDDWASEAQQLDLESAGLREAFEEGQMDRVATPPGHPWFGERFHPGSIVYVPLISHDRPEGVLALAARRRNALLRDQRLLAALGVVMGLALDNGRLYEGQRAHAQHLQELNRMKSDFLQTVSHELRTPLTSIMMAAEMLLEEEETRDPESARGRLVRNIVKGASRLSSLVADLVNVSREDEFQPRLELDPVPVRDVVANAVSIIQPLVAAKHQTIDVSLAAPESIVMVDRLRFEQVLINLLSNAQRYSPPGGHILVSDRVLRGEILICVTDSGPGVPSQDKELIFEPFHRGDRSGLGLGLAIAKSLVELHSGRVWVESAGRHGSTFIIALPTESTLRARPLVSPLARS